MRTRARVSSDGIQAESSGGGQGSGTGVLGINKNGEACKSCIRRGDFCHLHLHQMYSRSDATTQLASRRNIQISIPDGKSHKVFGITRTGEPCKRCIIQDTFCYQHNWQRDDGADPQDFQQPRIPTAARKDSTRIPVSFGLTKMNEPCKRCAMQNDFCFQHYSQRPRPVVATIPTATPTIVSEDGNRSATTSRSTRTLRRKSRTQPLVPPVMTHIEVEHAASLRSQTRRNASTLPTAETTTTKSEQEVEAEMCAICMENVESHQNAKTLNCCRNIYHPTCLNVWREHGGATCPTCRSPWE